MQCGNRGSVVKKTFGLAALTLIPFITLLGGCGGEDDKVFTGSVSTIAGMATASGVENGSGTLARFKLPSGITVYGTNLYIADSGNNIIRKIDLAVSGILVTTIAGDGVLAWDDGPGTTASFSNPSGITTDGTNLYVADTFNHTIRKMDVSASGVPVTTFAGTAPILGTANGTGAVARFTAPFAIVRNGTDLYVADTANNAIRKIDISGVVTTIAGNAASGVGSTDNLVGTLARFNKPEGITTDGFSLYVTDTGNNTIRKIDISSSGVPVTTLVGAPPPYVAGSADDTGINARFNSPVGIVRDGANLYVADSGNNTIRKIEIVTHKVTTLAGAANSPFPPPPNSGDGTGAAARFNSPQGITTDGISLYVTDTGNHTIRKIQ